MTVGVFFGGNPCAVLGVEATNKDIEALGGELESQQATKANAMEAMSMTKSDLTGAKKAVCCCLGRFCCFILFYFFLKFVCLFFFKGDLSGLCVFCVQS